MNTPPKAHNWYFTGDGPRVDYERPVLRIERTDDEPRIFVDGELTSDAERIGAAFKRWARAMATDAKDGEA